MSHNFVNDIKQIESDLEIIFNNARNEWLEVKGQIGEMSKTCSANIMHTLLLKFSKLGFRDRANIRVGEYNRKPLIIFSADKAEYQISLKKIDENFETHNVPTRQTELFNSGQPIPGLLKGQNRLNFGYQIDPRTHEPKKPSVTCYQTKINYPIQLEEEKSWNKIGVATEIPFVESRVKTKLAEENRSSENDNVISLYDRK